MYYVIELTCIGPKIKEVFKSKELAAQYTIALQQMLGLSSMFPNHVQLFGMLLMVGITSILIGAIMLLFIWLINMVNKL